MTTPQWITDAAREIEDTFLAHDAINDIAAMIASHYTAAQGNDREMVAHLITLIGGKGNLQGECPLCKRVVAWYQSMKPKPLPPPPDAKGG